MQEYDLFVIGGGSGGVRAARIAAQHGAKVGIAERRHWGGTCVHLGCVPKKLMVYASEIGRALEDAPSYGWRGVSRLAHQWTDLIEGKNKEISRLNEIYRNLLKNASIDIFEGEARIKEANLLEITPSLLQTQYNQQDEVKTITVRAKKIILAPGSRPRRLEIEGAEFAITSDDVFHLPQRPERIAIIGGGYIGVEFGGIFAGLGSETHLIYRQKEPLSGFDGEMRRLLKAQFPLYDICDHAEKNPIKIEKDGKLLRLFLDDGTVLEVDAVMMAVGRKPEISSLSLENLKIKTEGGHICVNEQFETSVPSIYAIGDVIDRYNLTPTAIAEGHLLAEQLFAPQGREWSFETTPKAVFFSSPLASVGMTEEEAQKHYKRLAIYTTSFTPMKHVLPKRAGKVFMKLIVDVESDIILGAHMMGSDGPEIIQILAIAVTQSLTKRAIDRTIALHPTTAEEFVTMRTATRFVG